MITLHILQLLEDEGFGTIDATTDGLYWEKLPLKGIGVAIFSRGTAMSRATRTSQQFDLYSRGTSDLLGADKLEKIAEYVRANFVACTLPTTPKSNKVYENVTLEVTGAIENLGLDETDRVIFRLPLEVKYDK